MEPHAFLLLTIILSMALYCCVEPTSPNICHGMPGLSGRDGRDGREGKEGPPGLKGEKGDKGVKVIGPPGKVGPPGQTGQKGDRGSPGANGQGGQKGDCGAPGTPGQPADVRRIAELERELRAMKFSLSKLEKRVLLTIWKSYGQKSFATRNSKGTFEGGLKLCAEAGGQIAMAANEEENEVIASFLKTGEYAFIGVTDRKTEGNFEDVNGNPVTFTKWKSGEPNNFDGNEDCTITSSEGIWNDVKCEAIVNIICQF